MSFDESGNFIITEDYGADQPYPERQDTPSDTLNIQVVDNTQKEDAEKRRKARLKLAIRSAVNEAIPGGNSTVHYAREAEDGVIYVQSSRPRNSENPQLVLTQMTIDKQTIDRHLKRLFPESDDSRLI